ncbi:conserved hypothetical protein [Dehalogenimonas lykanthroporepellens BL-DC-9]|nr:conserved hypothetical protein [Dehalogenimonas lykanthroporepellens BL-DC-9]
MVTDSGKTLHVDTLRAVNLPEPLEIRADADYQPLAVRRHRRWLQVAVIEDTWRLDDEWWRPAPLSRRYYAVMLAGGQRLTLFHDLAGGGWYHQSY